MQIYVHRQEFFKFHHGALAGTLFCRLFFSLRIGHKHPSRSVDRALTCFFPSHFKIAVYKYRCPIICSAILPLMENWVISNFGYYKQSDTHEKLYCDSASVPEL